MLSCDKLLWKAFQQDHPYVVGLDVSLTSTGVYFLSLKKDADHPDFYYHVTTTTKDGLDATRIDNVCRIISDDMSNPQYPVIAACIEDYGPSGRIAGKVLVRAELCGILKHIIRNELQIPYLLVSPNGLKKFASGKGRGDKTVTIKAAHDLGFTTKNSDEADAFHAARLCAAYLMGDKLSVSYNRINPKSYTFS